MYQLSFDLRLAWIQLSNSSIYSIPFPIFPAAPCVLAGTNSARDSEVPGEHPAEEVGAVRPWSFTTNDRTASCNSVTWASSNRCNATTLATAWTMALGEGVKGSFKFSDFSQMKAPRALGLWEVKDQEDFFDFFGHDSSFKKKVADSHLCILRRMWLRGAFPTEGLTMVWTNARLATLPEPKLRCEKGPLFIRCRCHADLVHRSLKLHPNDPLQKGYACVGCLAFSWVDVF